MKTTFFNASGAVLFVRDDMESGEWVQEEFTVNATFPLDKTKMIARGQMISFIDTATGNPEFFEIRNVTNVHADAYQQIIAEHISVSELSDDHINTMEITDKTPAQALTAVLTGTLWSVGNVSVTAVQSVDISRGSVWQAVGAIAQNWNCYIVPRVTTGTTGNITGRYLDVIPTTGTFRGLRLSMEKNIDDPSVVIDDTEVYTALYGYGGTVDVPQSGGAQDERQELTFSDVVWMATAEHPAKPSGQTYLEDPAATALYGRNGRPRYGYYQNSDIKDAEVLLSKTWEALQKAREPKISITGTVFDYFRYGCPDVPVRLHDIAIIEFTDTGEIYEKQIIKNRVDLIDQTGTTPEIGDYIPNIIYINRETAEKSGGGGGGGGHGQTNQEHFDGEIYTEWRNFEDQIGMVVGTYNGGYKIEAGKIVLAINQTTGESSAIVNADHINISATDDVYTLAGDLEHDASGRLVIKNAAGLYVQRNQALLGVWDKGNLTGGVMVQQINGQSSVKISGDVIDINGSSITISANRIDINGIVSKLLTEQISCASIHTTSGSNLFEGHCSFPDTTNIVDLTMLDGAMTYGGNAVTWQSTTIPTFTLSGTHNFVYKTNGVEYTTSGKIIGTNGTKTIHFLGRPNQ